MTTKERQLIFDNDRFAQHAGSCPEASMSGHCTCGYRKIKDETKEYLKQTEELDNGEATKTGEHLHPRIHTRGAETGRSSENRSE